MTRVLKMVALLAGASALVCVAAWTTVWTPGDQVAPALADIVDLRGHYETTTTKFQRGLDHLGHESPRPFDINGNTVYVSVDFKDMSPGQVLKRYQDEFVYQGINHSSYTSLEQAHTQAGRKDMLTGGIVPTKISRGYVAMGGGVAQNRAQTDRQLARLGADLAGGQVVKGFRAYRHIEAFRPPRARFTTVVATWSDETFDYRKMLAGSRVAGQQVDPTVPACPGCIRLQRFEDLGDQANHVDHVFSGPAGLQETLHFYDRVLAERGWEPTGSSAILERARRLGVALPPAHSRMYKRGGQTLTVVAYTGPNADTLVHLTLSGD